MPKRRSTIPPGGEPARSDRSTPKPPRLAQFSAIIAPVVNPPEPATTALDQTRAPYFQALLDYVDAGVIPFHTPGHKQGIGMERAFRDFVGDNVLAIDLTQIRGLDDLLQPEEALVEAQELAAACFGAQQSFFLINGSTSGNQCMMMAALNPGDKLAIPRNSHKSAMGGLIMSGATPVWMQPEVDEALHMDHTVTPETVRATLEREPDIKAIYLVSPTYYGVAADLEAIVADRARARYPAAGRRGVGPALPLPSRAAALGDASRRRHLHQLDPQDAGLDVADGDAARAGESHQARPPQSGLQAVPLDLAQSRAGRLARRRAAADGARRAGAALADDRDRERRAPATQRDHRASTASARSTKAARACSTSIR